MSTIRDSSAYKLKNDRVVKAQLGCKCRLEDCDNELTVFEGPGSDMFCRDHQLMLAEYGEGLGRTDRLHTFYRGWVCDECKYDPRQDPQFDDIEDPYHRLRCMRGVMHGDHLIRKSDGGSDTADNIRTLCCRCHMIKTYKEKDYLKGNKQTNISESNE